MAEYKLNYTAEEIDEILGTVKNGKVEVINLLDEYEIDLAELVMSGEKSRAAGRASQALWPRLMENRNVEFLVILDDYTHFYLKPSSISTDEDSGTAKTVSLTLQTMYQMSDDSLAMINAKIVMVNNTVFTSIYSDTTFVPMV